MTIQIRNHGGSCCGRYHLFRFWGSGRDIKTKSKINKNTYEDFKNNFAAYAEDGMCIEICLREDQAMSRGYKNMTWNSVLKKHGFKMVYKFRNPNSGRIIYVYMYSSNKL